MIETESHIKGRIAPSPTGFLHLGNIWSFLLNWLFIKSSGGSLILRIDDIDPIRSKPEYTEAIMEDLFWLGITWDNPSDIIFQSNNDILYSKYLAFLQDKSLIYPCFCSRKELTTIANAPHLGENSYTYSGRCANLSSEMQKFYINSGKAFALRLRCKNQKVDFFDEILGEKEFTFEQFKSDFPIRRSDGVWSYQFATVIDDNNSNITFVVRGKDLLESCARQIIIHNYFDFILPKYAHHPLLLDKYGDRLAKRHDSLAIQKMRKRGVQPERIIGYLTYLLGINDKMLSGKTHDFLEKFTVSTIPKDNIKICNLNFA